MAHSDNPASRTDDVLPVAGDPGTEQHAHDPAGESVLNIIADVEAQIHRIRSMQSAQDDQIASLEQRADAIRHAEEALSSRQQDLDRAEAELRSERESLSADRARVESDLSTLAEQQAELDAARQTLQAERASFDHATQSKSAELQERADRLERQQKDLDTAQEMLNEHWRELNAERERLSAEAETQQQKLEAMSAELDAARQQAEAESTQAAAVRQQLEQLRAEQADVSGRLEKAEQNVGELIHELEAANNALESQSGAATQAQKEAESLRSRVSELESTLETTTTKAAEAEQQALEMAEQAERERDEVRERLTVASEELTSLRERFTTAEETIAEQTASLTKKDQTLEAAKGKLREFSELLKQQSEQIERGAAAMAQVRDQKQQIDRLRDELAKAKVAGDYGAIERKDQRIAELTEALRQARGQTIDNADVTERDRRIDELLSEVDRLRLELERSTLELDEANRALASGQGTADNGVVLPMHDDRAEKAEAEAGALRERIEELEAQLQEAIQQVDAAAKTQDQSEAAKALRQKAARIRAFAEHLTLRRKRLQRMRKLLGERRAGGLETSATPNTAEQHKQYEHAAQHSDQLRKEREALAQVARCLSESETVMIQKWARPRALTLVACLLVVLSILAAGSWLATDRFLPAIRSATVVIEAQARPGFPLTDEQSEAWQIWHEEMLEDPAFLRTAARRFADRRMPSWSDPNALGERLKADLSLDSTRDGELILTLVGADPNECMLALDTLAVTLVAESRRVAGQRTDGARTILRGERREGSMTRYASMNEVPVQDDRLQNAGIIFGVGTFFTLLLLGLTYSKLSRAKHVFDTTGVGLPLGDDDLDD